MKKALIFTFTLIFVSNGLFSQDFGNTIEGLTICSKLGSNNFSNSRAADEALDEIVGVIGVSKTFVLQACENVSNASALTVLGVRYIFYNPSWMNDLMYSGDWVNKFILAHEVGHHVNNHTVDAALLIGGMVDNNTSLSESKYQELQADEFAGFVLGRLGATLNETLAAVNNLSNDDDTYSTHPKRDKRISAVTKGYKNSGGKLSEIGNVAKGKIVDSPYSNSRYSGVEYQSRGDIFDNGIYEGYIAISTNKPFGFGTYFAENGYKYEGEWANSQPNGYGKASWPDGTYYEGFFVNWKFSGNGVIYNSYSDCKYVGNFSDGELDGQGKMIYDSGTILDGVFSNGNIIKVTRTLTDGNQTEMGFLDNSGGTGFATFTDHNGITYTGYWKNGVIVGKPVKKHKGKESRRWARQTGLDHFIPEFILDGLNINFDSGYGDEDGGDEVGLLEKRFPGNTSSIKGYFKQSFWQPRRAGFVETTIPEPEKEKWAGYSFPKYDKSYSIYWNDERNGYCAFFLDGKLVQKAIYQNGKFVKDEDFDLKLMVETYKVW